MQPALSFASKRLLILLILGTIASAFVRPYYEAYRLNEIARQLVERGETESAISYLRGAVSWRAPFSSSSAHASLQLLRIAEDTRNRTVARSAAEELWRGLASSRSIWWMIPGAWRGVSTEQAQFVLEANLHLPSERVTDPAIREPNFIWQLAALFSFLLWISVVISGIFSLCDSSGKLQLSNLRTITKYALGAVATFCAWLLALSQA